MTRTPVAVLCAFLGSEQEIMFARLENPWIYFRYILWVLRRSCCLRSTTGGIIRANRSVCFELGSIEEAFTLRYGNCCLTGILVTG